MSKTLRKAFIMSVHRGAEDEYKRRHEKIWTELEGVLKEHGVNNYSIFLDKETCQLFGYAEIESEELWQEISQTDACQRWWQFMKELMVCNEDASPVSKELEEVFHLA